MPIANAINQANASRRPVKALSPPTHRCPERPWCAAQGLAQPALPPRPVINWSQTRQTQGRDVSTRIKEATGATYRKLGHVRTKNVSVRADRSGRFLRDPYPAFSTAISVQFTVAGASSDSARQTHWPATARAQMLWTQAIPTHAGDSDLQGRSCRDGGHN